MAQIDLAKLFPPSPIDHSHHPLPRQAEFLNLLLNPSGPQYIGYYGGFGCVAAETHVETSEGPIAITAIRPHHKILSYNAKGPVYVSGTVAYPKGKDYLYRVIHEHGQFVAHGCHLVLGADGRYQFVDQLEVGYVLSAPDSSAPLPTNSVSDPLESLPDVARLFEKSSDFLDYCSRYYHQYGQLPPSALNTAQEIVPLLIDALKYTLSVEHTDDLSALIRGDIHPDRLCCLFDSLSSSTPHGHPLKAWGDCISSLVSEQTSPEHQESQLSRSMSEFHRINQLHFDGRVDAVCPYQSKILSITKSPTKECYWDLTIPSTGNYVAEGSIHHNSGKSVTLIISIILQAVIYGGEYLIARAFNPELKRTVWKQFLDLCPKDLIHDIKIADMEVHIKSATGKPACVYFVGMDSPDKIDSMNLSGFAIDEASHVAGEAFLKLQGRLRNPLGLRKGIIVGNPRGKNWAYRKFVSKVEVAPGSRHKYHMIVAPSTENIHLPDGYVQNMLDSYSAERVKRDVYGSFDSFEGQIFTEWDRSVHIVKPFAIPDKWTRLVGADHGFTNPAAFVWGAVDHDDNIYIYKEFYQSGLVIKDICKEIIKINGKDKIDAIYIDPSTRGTRGQTGVSDFATYTENLPKKWALIPARNDVHPGIDRVKTYLKIQPKSGKPRLVIFDTCPNLIEEITQYQWDELGPGLQGRVNEKEQPKKYNDHSVDALRYLVMSRPEGPAPEDQTKKGLNEPTLEASVRRELYEIKHPEPKDPFGDY